MSAFRALLARELFAFFVTPLAWVLLVVFLVVQGLHFSLLVQHFSSAADAGADQSPVQAFFGNTAILYLVLFLLVPALTMRLFAEERRSGTLESLLTAPISPAAVVLAKYLGAFLTYLALWVPTALYLVVLRQTGAIDWNAALTGYLGLALVGGAYLAVGLLMSALTSSQFIALVLTALVMLGLFIVGIGEFVATPNTPAYAVCHHVSMWAQMGSFSSGIIDTRHVVFNLSVAVTCLFVTVRIVDSWRQEGRA
jgi:ABC-2 type transport system permease protein